SLRSEVLSADGHFEFRSVDLEFRPSEDPKLREKKQPREAACVCTARLASPDRGRAVSYHELAAGACRPLGDGFPPIGPSDQARRPRPVARCGGAAGGDLRGSEDFRLPLGLFPGAHDTAPDSHAAM